MNINGSLNFCKPAGKTSYDIVRLVKNLTRQKKVGHGGTLDPLASGVLPICIGQATRVTEYLAEADKSYKADVVLGVTTDTYDAEGEVVATRDPSGVTRELLEETLGSFRGAIDQEPPMYSALKHEGKRLYQLAREGVVVERKKRATMIYRPRGHGLGIPSSQHRGRVRPGRLHPLAGPRYRRSAGLRSPSQEPGEAEDRSLRHSRLRRHRGVLCSRRPGLLAGVSVSCRLRAAGHGQRHPGSSSGAGRAFGAVGHGASRRDNR